MIWRLLIAVALLPLFLGGCSREDEHMISFIRLNNGAISSGNSILFDSKAPVVTFSWEVSYTSPNGEYWIELYLTDDDVDQAVAEAQSSGQADSPLQPDRKSTRLNSSH